ncbi:hypothetical protein B0H14DRAFT_2627788 [Mycena olivaceomarginata]|nr:hypothetical protein B0H14DRAFT_2627788 [Mycena olivaceomarginata]
MPLMPEQATACREWQGKGAHYNVHQVWQALRKIIRARIRTAEIVPYMQRISQTELVTGMTNTRCRFWRSDIPRLGWHFECGGRAEYAAAAELEEGNEGWRSVGCGVGASLKTNKAASARTPHHCAAYACGTMCTYCVCSSSRSLMCALPPFGRGGLADGSGRPFAGDGGAAAGFGWGSG